MTDLSDEELCELAVGGDREAAEEIAIRYRPRAAKLLNRVITNKTAYWVTNEMRKDIEQDMLVQLVAKLPVFDRTRAKLTTFAEKVMLHECIRSLKKEYRPLKLPTYEYDGKEWREVPAPSSFGPVHIMEAKDERGAVVECLTSLSEAEREQIISIRYVGETHIGYAARVGVSLANSRQKLKRALEKVRLCLKGKGFDEGTILATG